MKSYVLLIGLLGLLFSASVFSQQFSTLGEIYNFDPDDEFHTIEYNCCNDVFFTLQKVKILEKTNEQGAIQYIRNIDLFSYVNVEPPILADTLLFNQIDTLNILFPDSIIFSNDDEIVTNLNLYNRRKICIKHSIVLDKPKTDKYVDGCGHVVTSWYIECDSSCRISDSLVYYKKGKEKWGINRFQTNIENNLINEFNISQNPVINTLQIDFPKQSSPTKLVLYEQGGANIISSSWLKNKESYTMDMSHFKKGVYLLHINNLNNNKVYRIIKH
ncbi:T9SS type A sorting domain-containing protein [Desulfosarcina sp.]|nr:T9SS type A sorting domain-containing protein [Desulfosarcina sp.]